MNLYHLWNEGFVLDTICEKVVCQLLVTFNCWDDCLAFILSYSWVCCKRWFVASVRRGGHVSHKRRSLDTSRPSDHSRDQDSSRSMTFQLNNSQALHSPPVNSTIVPRHLHNCELWKLPEMGVSGNGDGPETRGQLVCPIFSLRAAVVWM